MRRQTLVWNALGGTYILAVCVIAWMQHSGSIDPITLASTPEQLHQWELWRMVSSAFVIPQLALFNIIVLVLASWRAAKSIGVKSAVLACFFGHVCGTLINYMYYLFAVRFTGNLADKLALPDFGISLVWSALIGAVAAAGGSVAWRRIALFALVPIVIYDIGHQEVQHIVAFVVGAFFGAATPDTAKMPWWRHWRSSYLVDAVAILVLFNGLVALVAPLAKRFPDDLASLPFSVEYVSRSASVAIGLVMIYVSFALFRRKQAAWIVATIGSLGLLISHSVSHGGIASLTTLTALVSLSITRNLFTVRYQTESLRRAVAIGVVAALLLLIFGTAGFLLLDKRDFGTEFSISEAATRTVQEFTWSGNADLRAATEHGEWFLHALDGAAILLVILVTYSVFRPVRYRFSIRPSERALAQELLARHGDSELDFFKLYPDNKSFFFGSKKAGFLAYRVHHGVAVVLGDPVAPYSEKAPILSEFSLFCEKRGWHVALVYASPEMKNVYRKLGWRVLMIGQTARVDLELFTKETIRKKNFRRVRNKFAELYPVQYSTPPHDSRLLDQITEVSEEWIRQPGKTERAFGLGYFTRPYVMQTPLFYLESDTGKVEAFVNLVPSYRHGEATIDMMRHRVAAENGVLDYLFSELFLKLHQDGFRYFDLGYAPLSNLGSRNRKSMEESLLLLFSRLPTGVFSFEGLQRYKNKFDPEWEDRYLAYSGTPAMLPQVALAIAAAMKP